MNATIFNNAWDPTLAANSFTRWQEVIEKENWRYEPAINSNLIKVFGASWYFTRLIFFHGNLILPVFENKNGLPTQNYIENAFKQIDTSLSIDIQFEKLRTIKNKLMLTIFLADLAEEYSRQEIEQALTLLAISSFKQALFIYFQNSDYCDNLLVLAMGRMAGLEMNYGSDLDMVFLSYGKLDDQFYKLSQKILTCIRTIAHPSPEGLLYEIDTRLRPHGNSGTLITRFEAFILYHSEPRELWEKQMMTRCKLIFGDEQRLYKNGFNHVIDTIYNKKDNNYLASQIYEMRKTVEQQVGSPYGKHDVKKGVGGIRDIDFIKHYIQLKHRVDDFDFRKTSTRKVLHTAYAKKIFDEKTHNTLLENYDFLKKLEARLRVFDMKAIDTIDKDFTNNKTLARSMGYEANENGLIDFQDEFLSKIKSNRELLQKIVV